MFKFILGLLISAIIFTGCARPMWLYAQRNNVKGIEKKLKAGEDVNTEDVVGQTPLHSAAEYGRVRAIKILVKNGAIVDKYDHHGQAPLFLAVYYFRAEAVNELIKSGADVKNKLHKTDDASLNGATYMHVLAMASYDEYDLYKFIKSSKSSRANLYNENDMLNTLKYLYKAGIDINSVNDRGQSALHFLSYGKNHRIKTTLAMAMVKLGANVNLQDKNGNTPAHLAAQGLMTKVLKGLFASGADIDNIRNKQGLTVRELYNLKLRNDPLSWSMN